LDRYFDDIIVEKVRTEDEGWNMIGDRPMLWGGIFDLLSSVEFCSQKLTIFIYLFAYFSGI